MPEIQLKPCPFCGSKNLDMDSDYEHWVVVCKDCMAAGPSSFEKTLAALYWNCATTLEWTDTPPTERGFYFCREPGQPYDIIWFEPGMKLADRETRWAGPIPLPAEIA